MRRQRGRKLCGLERKRAVYKQRRRARLSELRRELKDHTRLSLLPLWPSTPRFSEAAAAAASGGEQPQKDRRHTLLSDWLPSSLGEWAGGRLDDDLKGKMLISRRVRYGCKSVSLGLAQPDARCTLWAKCLWQDYAKENTELLFLMAYGTGSSLTL